MVRYNGGATASISFRFCQSLAMHKHSEDCLIRKALVCFYLAALIKLERQGTAPRWKVDLGFFFFFLQQEMGCPSIECWFYRLKSQWPATFWIHNPCFGMPLSSPGDYIGVIAVYAEIPDEDFCLAVTFQGTRYCYFFTWKRNLFFSQWYCRQSWKEGLLLRSYLKIWKHDYPSLLSHILSVIVTTQRSPERNIAYCIWENLCARLCSCRMWLLLMVLYPIYWGNSLFLRSSTNANIVQ